jgi:hypothetical protein
LLTKHTRCSRSVDDDGKEANPRPILFYFCFFSLYKAIRIDRACSDQKYLH